ncbi:site-2 protease family protein [Mycobacterium sp.]|uniref:site-2 protease family protein n=1 Tax=Mycobacterium sp. TaxID=1785 RepID=UPI003A83511E
MNNPGTHASVRPSPIFLGLVAATAAGGTIAWTAGSLLSPQAYAGVFVFVIAGWLVSLCLHEFGHAYTAWRFGDHGVAVRGYLTLDPRRYSHIGLSLVLPIVFTVLGGIGLPGAAVYLQTAFMAPVRRTLISLAGPAANLCLAAVLLGSIRLFYDPAHVVFSAGLAFLGFLQITALVLNLLPIPGLDGYNALEPYLSPETQRAVAPAKPYGVLILFFLLISPGLNRWFFGVVYWLFGLSGVPPRLAMAGDALTRFWSVWF